MLRWHPTLLGIFEQYFKSDLVIAGILVAGLALVASFAIFAFSKSHVRKSSAMLSAMVISTSLWVFVLSSLVFCVGLIKEYANSPTGGILNVVKLAIVPTIILGPIMFYLLRNRAMKQIYPFFTFTPTEGAVSSSGSDIIQVRASSIFSSLLSSARLSGIALSVVPAVADLPSSAALDWKGKKIVAVSSRAVLALDDDELKAVLAHELGHIVHRDSLRKTIVTAYRSAFIFDPIARFVEAAVYRDGEFYADEYSAQLTGKPAALASALIKIHESTRSSLSNIPTTQGASLLLSDHDSGIFSKQASLTLRIKKLLEMEDLVPAIDRVETEDNTAAQ